MHLVKKCVQVVCAVLMLSGLSVAQAGEKVAPHEFGNEFAYELGQELGLELLPAELLELEQYELEGSTSFNQIRDRERERRERERCRRTGRCQPPRQPRPQPGYLCFAVNEFRQQFQGYDRYSARWAQDLALRTCYRYSRVCRPAGCRYY